MYRTVSSGFERFVYAYASLLNVVLCVYAYVSLLNVDVSHRIVGIRTLCVCIRFALERGTGVLVPGSPNHNNHHTAALLESALI
jgi:hypothetical protein